MSPDVAPGERVALTGPSGSGKTTLLTTLGGLPKPAVGRVLVGGVPLAERPDLRRETALVFQSYGLLSLPTAAENVEVAHRVARRTGRGHARPGGGRPVRPGGRPAGGGVPAVTTPANAPRNAPRESSA
ncbi:ATP-binding cassette domain-containing protein [Microbispora sp. NPDC004025]